MSIPEGRLCTWITMPGRVAHVGRVVPCAVAPADNRVKVVEWDGGWLDGFDFVPEQAINYVTKDFLSLVMSCRAEGCDCSPFRLVTGRHETGCVLHGVTE